MTTRKSDAATKKTTAKTTAKTTKKRATAKSARPQLGWSDWLQNTEPPLSGLPPRPVASAEERSREEQALSKLKVRPGRDWSKLEFEKSKPYTSPAKPTAPAASVDEPTESVASKGEPSVLTVSALNKMIRGKLETTFSVLWLKGEISNFKAHPSGHFYFSLKDKTAQIQAVMFRGFNSQLRFKPEDGLEVLVRGKITVYEPRGNYQIMCESMEPVGAGALQKAFEQLKKKLAAEGLFDAARKRPIPQVPKHIAIVTSPTGAAIRDMLHVLSRRYKAARITVVPCVVQGDRAPKEIIQAISLANKLSDVDVLIVGRGGGSIEDLWAFNDEGVARAIAGSRVPVISAVGHEVDFTIADFVADLRAPTPSAAAELVAKSASELLAVVSRLQRALAIAVLTRINRAMDRVRTAQRLLTDPRKRIQDAVLRCDDLIDRLERAIFDSIDQMRTGFELMDERLASRMRRRLDQNRERLARGGAVLDSLSPLRVLDRGYALATVPVKSGDGSGLRTLTRARDVKKGDHVFVRLAEGEIETSVVSVTMTGKE